MADPRLFLSNMRFAKNALEAASNILQQDSEKDENKELTAVCVSIGEKAKALAKMLEHEEKMLLKD